MEYWKMSLRIILLIELFLQSIKLILINQPKQDKLPTGMPTETFSSFLSFIKCHVYSQTGSVKP